MQTPSRLYAAAHLHLFGEKRPISAPLFHLQGAHLPAVSRPDTWETVPAPIQRGVQFPLPRHWVSTPLSLVFPSLFLKLPYCGKGHLPCCVDYNEVESVIKRLKVPKTHCPQINPRNPYVHFNKPFWLLWSCDIMTICFFASARPTL